MKTVILALHRLEDDKASKFAVELASSLQSDDLRVMIVANRIDSCGNTVTANSRGIKIYDVDKKGVQALKQAGKNVGDVAITFGEKAEELIENNFDIGAVIELKGTEKIVTIVKKLSEMLEEEEEDTQTKEDEEAEIEKRIEEAKEEGKKEGRAELKKELAEKAKKEKAESAAKVKAEKAKNKNGNRNGNR